MRTVFSFPDTVNEFSARQVAGGVVILSLAYALTGSIWLLAALAYGFVARVLTGPTLSPLGQLVTRVITPASERMTGRTGPVVAGTPKRFAQGIGVTLSLSALALHLTGFGEAALVATLAITAAATLESVFGYCLGCAVFARLMSAGLVPESVCAECMNISDRLAEAALQKTTLSRLS